MSAAEAKGAEHLKPNKGTNEIGTDPFSESIVVNVERKLSLPACGRQGRSEARLTRALWISPLSVGKNVGESCA
jgi:hypothetical protein